jgi:Uma2 family endonuclease
MILRTEWLDSPAVAIPANTRTLAGFRRWALSDEFPETGSITYCQGELLVDMSPQRLDSHSKVKGEIFRVLSNLARDLNIGTVYDDGTLVTNDPADLSTEPDTTFVSWETVRSGRVKRTRSRDGRDHVELVGAPDMVLEVVSPGSVGKDTRKLRAAYHAAGIPEYWLVDARGDKIKFELLVRHPRTYKASHLARGWAASPVFGRSFRLTRERDPLGDWSYTLETR